MEAYYEDDTVQLFLGDMREILPALGVTADLIVADPPYGETAHAWDRWPNGWLKVVAAHSNAMWCFGSQRMFFEHLGEFQAAGWKLSQDVVGHTEDGEPIVGDVNVVWEKHNGTGFATDRFKRVHEHVLHFYRGPWGNVHQDVPRTVYTGPDKHTRARGDRGEHLGKIGSQGYDDDGTRLMRSVIKVKSVRDGIHKTEKPFDLLLPLLQYGCPPGGLVVDPFGGSCSTLLVAREAGVRAIAIEGHEPHAEAAAKRLAEPYMVSLFSGGAA